MTASEPSSIVPRRRSLNPVRLYRRFNNRLKRRAFERRQKQEEKKRVSQEQKLKGELHKKDLQAIRDKLARKKEQHEVHSKQKQDSPKQEKKNLKEVLIHKKQAVQETLKPKTKTESSTKKSSGFKWFSAFSKEKKEASITTKKAAPKKELSLHQKGMLNDKLMRKARKKEQNRHILRKYLNQAGYEYTSEAKVMKNMFRVIVAICMFFSLIALIVASVNESGVGRSLLFMAGIWTGVFAGLFILAWILLYVFLDLKVFKRTAQLEEVLPDYLQLASANISAGMPVDRALWFAVRPRFGILAKEIEHVAKATFSGQDLKVSLLEFASKYDSITLKRSINLLIEGMEAGGELAELLNKIAINIQETKILKKEMAANVMTYAIFIGFASVVAAPILYALSGQLLIIIQQIMGMLAENSGGEATSGSFMAFDVSGGSITLQDYTIFSVVTLLSTSLFSSFIISTIRKGSIKDGFRFIPVLVIATIILYFISRWILGLLLGGIIDL